MITYAIHNYFKDVMKLRYHYIEMTLACQLLTRAGHNKTFTSRELATPVGLWYVCFRRKMTSCHPGGLYL